MNYIVSFLPLLSTVIMLSIAKLTEAAALGNQDLPSMGATLLHTTHKRMVNKAHRKLVDFIDYAGADTHKMRPPHDYDRHLTDLNDYRGEGTTHKRPPHDPHAREQHVDVDDYTRNQGIHKLPPPHQRREQPIDLDDYPKPGTHKLPPPHERSVDNDYVPSGHIPRNPPH